MWQFGEPRQIRIDLDISWKRERGHSDFLLGGQSSGQNGGTPRTARAPVRWVCFHVLNCGNASRPVFHKAVDFAPFAALLEDACGRLLMRLRG
jgi:hypothetical protein